MTHLPCSKATHAKVKIKPKSYSGCTRNFQRVPRLRWVLPGDVCLLPFLPHSLAGDKVNTQHFALVLHCSLFKQINPSLWHSDQMTEAFPNMKAACYTSSAARGCHRGGVPTLRSKDLFQHWSKDYLWIACFQDHCRIWGSECSTEAPSWHRASVTACLCVLTPAFNPKAGKYLKSCHHLFFVAFSGLESYWPIILDVPGEFQMTTNAKNIQTI